MIIAATEVARGPVAAPSRSLRLRWGVLSTLGLAVGLPIGALLLNPLELVVGMFLVTPTVFAISGAILGTSQWFAVRYLARAAVWISLSAVGLAIGLTVGTVAVELLVGWIAGGPVYYSTASAPTRAIAFLSLGGIGGATLGAAQWMCLRRCFRGGARWVSANGLGLALGMLIGFAAAEIVAGGIRSPLGALTLLMVAAATSGLVTGRVLEAHARDAARAFRLRPEKGGRGR